MVRFVDGFTLKSATWTFDNISAGHEYFDHFIFGTKPPGCSAKFAETRRATFRISSYYFLIARHALAKSTRE